MEQKFTVNFILQALISIVFGIIANVMYGLILHKYILLVLGGA